MCYTLYLNGMHMQVCVRAWGADACKGTGLCMHACVWGRVPDVNWGSECQVSKKPLFKFVVICHSRDFPSKLYYYTMSNKVSFLTPMVLQDDVIDEVGELIAAAECLKENGAYKIYAAATHGVLSKDSPELLDQSPIDEVN